MASFLVIGPHPDDQELGMGGTIARLAQQGHKVHLVDMTNGEPTPHGSVEMRAGEAASAAGILGVERTLAGAEESRSRSQPRIAATSSPPSFVSTSPTGCSSRIRSTRIPITSPSRASPKTPASTPSSPRSNIPGEPWHPKRIIYYFCTHLRMNFQPSFCIDISDQIDLKMKACAVLRIAGTRRRRRAR